MVLGNLQRKCFLQCRFVHQFVGLNSSMQLQSNSLRNLVTSKAHKNTYLDWPNFLKLEPNLINLLLLVHNYPFLVVMLGHWLINKNI